MNKFDVIGWYAIFFQAICFALQIGYNENLFLIPNISFMVIALICFSISKRRFYKRTGEEK